MYDLDEKYLNGDGQTIGAYTSVGAATQEGIRRILGNDMQLAFSVVNRKSGAVVAELTREQAREAHEYPFLDRMVRWYSEGYDRDWYSIEISWDNAKVFGINYLTSEADAMGFRKLVDLTEHAADLYAEFSGGAFPQSKNNNPGSEYSIFLTQNTFIDFFVWCVFRSATRYDDKYQTQSRMKVYEGRVYLTTKSYNPESAFDKINTRCFQIYRAQPRSGLSNIHAFTGRSQ